MRILKPIGIALLAALVIFPSYAAQSETGSLCIAPIGPTGGQAWLRCPSAWSLRIDMQKPIPWPRAKSFKIDGLDVTTHHRIVVFCSGKAQQSFVFNFAEFKHSDLCLFLNDLYVTAQLWDPKVIPTPWCKCIQLSTQ